jgi:FKBP-type peptidyl-prolyl cis-trans isomerase SlyD
MKAEKNTIVSLSYRLTENDEKGALIEEVPAEKPFEFLFGGGNLIPGFEANVNNLGVGDAFAFSVKAEEAYGEYDIQSVVNLPLSIFQQDGVLDTSICQVGNVVPMRNDQGQQFSGTITAVGEAEVTMDFNHPLAGKSLYFKGVVVALRQATAEELEHGHVHHAHGHDEDCH